MTTPASRRLADEVESVLADYTAHLSKVSAGVNPAEARAARELCVRFDGPSGFAAASLAEQVIAPRPALRFIDWLVTSPRVMRTGQALWKLADRSFLVQTVLAVITQRLGMYGVTAAVAAAVLCFGIRLLGVRFNVDAPRPPGQRRD